MGESLKEIFKMGKCKDMVNFSGKMEHHIKEPILMIRKRAGVYSDGLMEDNTRANGLGESKVAEEDF